MSRTNEHGQPIGDAVDWSPRPPVAPVTLEGRTVRLEPLAEHHVDDLADGVPRAPGALDLQPLRSVRRSRRHRGLRRAAPREPPTCRWSSWWTAARSGSSA